tara:strand:- start:495 stop:971 length:477 start_codon:yes stop_codon:yes gene_type:complete
MDSELNIKYRYMLEADIEISRAIEVGSNPVPWSKKNFLDCLNRDYYCLIQEFDNKVSGFAIQSFSLNESHLLNIGIQETFRNKGLGQELLDQMVYASESMGSKKIFLEVRVSNKPAIKLYYKSGFKKISVRKNYYRLPVGREDAFLMSKKLKRPWRLF